MSEIAQKNKATRPVKKLTIKDTKIMNQLSLTSLLKDKTFREDCNKTLELARKVDSYLKGWLIPSIVPIVNSMSINLKLPPEARKLNSCLLVSPRGTGKSVLLEDMLAKSNPNHFVILPAKVFESELVEKNRDYFHNKILIQSDLIVTFEGLSKKQRQQLTNFWTKILEGSYGRDSHQLSDVRTMTLFGFASEMLNKFRDNLLSETFFDRVTPFLNEVTEIDKRRILNFRSKNNPLGNHKIRTPSIRLPLPDKIEDEFKMDVKFPHDEKIEQTIIDLSMELDRYGVQSFARAQDYIKVFMMCNAVLNSRKKVSLSDLRLYTLVHPLFLNSMRELETEDKIHWLYKKYPEMSDRELMKKAGVSKPTFYKYKKILKSKGMISET